jgi:hypothetical protein
VRTVKIHRAKVIPFPSRNSVTQQIAELAFAYWQERFGIRDGSRREDLLRAHREVSCGMRRERLFLVPGPRGESLGALFGGAEIRQLSSARSSRPSPRAAKCHS